MLHIFLLFLFVPHYIKGFDVQNELYKPVDVPSPSPINVLTTQVQPIVTKTPLTLYCKLTDVLNVTNKGNIIDIHPNPGNEHHIYGGILGSKTYKFVKGRIYITQNPIGRSGDQVDFLGGPLEPTLIYQNVNYSTFEEALQQPDGVAIFAYCVIISPTFQEKFFPFQLYLEDDALKKPGSSVQIYSGFVYRWFDHVKVFKSYFAYRGSYLDIDTKKLHYGATYIIPSPQVTGLSLHQFKAFQNVLGNNGKPIEAPAPIYPQGKRIAFQSLGVRQIIK